MAPIRNAGPAMADRLPSEAASLVCTPARASNTTKAYSSRQNEWNNWCDQHGAAGCLVTSDKLMLFLESYVLKKQPSRKRGRRASSHLSANSEDAGRPHISSPLDTTFVNADTPDLVDQDTAVADSCSEPNHSDRLSYASVELYVSAVVDLWKQQVQRDENHYPSPRTDDVKDLLRRVRKQQRQTQQVEAKPEVLPKILWAGGVFDDLLDRDELAELTDDGLERNSYDGIRDRLMIAMTRHADVRGENLRNLKLTELHKIKLVSLKVPVHFIAITGQLTRNDLVGVMRNAKLEGCAIGALALYLFCKFEMKADHGLNRNGSGNFPDFTSVQGWEHLKLFSLPQSATTAIPKAVHAKKFREAFLRCGIVEESKLEHAMRSTKLRREDKWQSHWAYQCPGDKVRVEAGFNFGEDSPCLLRDVPVPLDLQSCVFPGAVTQLSELKVGRSPSMSKEDHRAAIGFLELLVDLRSVLIQDAVLLKRKCPHHFVFQHPLFQSDDFKKFEKTMLGQIQIVEAFQIVDDGFSDVLKHVERTLGKDAPSRSAILRQLARGLQAGIAAAKKEVEDSAFAANLLTCPTIASPSPPFIRRVREIVSFWLSRSTRWT